MEKKRVPYLTYILAYGFYDVALAMYSILIALYMMDRGMSATQVSLTVSASCAASMALQPAVAVLQDRGDKKRVTVILLLLCAVMGPVFLLQNSFWGILAAYSVGIALLSSVSPYLEQLATVSPYPYRSIRIWGTLGYAVGAQIAGVVYDMISPQSIYLFFSAAALISAFGLCRTREKESPVSSEPPPKPSGYRRELLGNRLFLAYLAVAALFYAAMNISCTYLPTLYRQCGVSVTMTSTVIFIATCMELPVLLFSSHYMNRLSNAQLLVLTFFGYLLQFVVYAFVPWVGVKIAATILLKSSVNIVFLMTSLKVVSTIIPPAYQMTAFTLVSAISKNLFTVLFLIAGGSILDSASIEILYAVLAGCSALGLIFSILIKMPTDPEHSTKF